MRRDDTPRLLDPASLLLIAPLCVIGAIIQFLGGPRRQVGVLLATGLLIPFPIAGWAVLAGIAGRIVWQRFANAAGMEVFGAGVIAGDSPFAFFHSAWGAMRK
jgi:hypothetical protein